MSDSKHDLWIANTDGACRGNPGLSGAGVYVVAPDGGALEFKKFLGQKTNNQAEYEAMLLALEELVKQGAKKITLRADSELMIKQMRGEYRVKNPHIAPLYGKACEISKQFLEVHFEHVRREFNREADRLANEAIDERQS